MKKKYTLSEDGFVGYWHPAGGMLAEYRDQDACNQARADSMKEILEFLDGWK